MNKSVMKCCICNNENIGQFITINNKKYHLCCIEQLQQENKQLKEELEYTIGIVEHNRIISEKNKEIHQLKDNWIKLKEYIRKNIIYDDVGMKILDPSPLEDYMQELERSDSNEI